jgi:hypothetical protein
MYQLITLPEHQSTRAPEHPRTRATNKMEQINFIKEDDTVFNLSIFYNYNLYELKICCDDLESDIIELDYLDEIIQQGLRPNQVKKIDEHLSVKTQLEENLDEKILKITVQLVFKKGKLKASSEKHVFVLRQKVIDTQQTFENVMRGTERTLNLPHIQPSTTNLFIEMDSLTGDIHFVDESCETVHLIKMNEFDYRFLSYLELKFLSVAIFYQNKQKSQDSILKFNTELVKDFFESSSIYAVIANYFAYTYYCNFISVIEHGRRIMVNVSLNKQPKEAVYHVTEKLTTFNFNGSLHYRILSDFTIGNIQEEKHCNEVEICYTPTHGYLVYEKRKLAKDKFVYIMDKNYYIKTNSNGVIEMFYQADRKSIYNGESNVIKSPSEMIRIVTNGSGKMGSIYVNHCGATLSCNCSSLASYPHTRILFQEADCQDGGPQKTLYLIEQF